MKQVYFLVPAKESIKYATTYTTLTKAIIQRGSLTLTD